MWKLSLALNHPDQRFDDLLRGYDLERRPIGERVGKTSLINMQSHALILDKALGLSPDKTEAANVAAMQQYFDPQNDVEGQAKRKEVQRALKELDIEFYAHGAEVGWFYDLPYRGVQSGRDIDNPQVKPDGSMRLCEYLPTMRPGSQLPHAWLRNSDSQDLRSTRELIGTRLTLLAFVPGWQYFTHPLLELEQIGPDGPWQFADEALAEQFHDVLPSGALIVRPDRIIAYRFDDDAVLGQSDLVRTAADIVATILRLQA